MGMPPDGRIAETLIDLANRRGQGKSFCPSEAARALARDWRPLMPAIRRVAADLHVRGVIEIRQKDRRVDPSRVKGPIRLGLPD